MKAKAKVKEPGPMEIVELNLAPPDNARLANLCGAMDDNIARLSRALSVDIRRRGAKFRLSGPAPAPRAAAETLRALYARADRMIIPRDVQICVAETMNGETKESAVEGMEVEGGDGMDAVKGGERVGRVGVSGDDGKGDAENESAFALGPDSDSDFAAAANGRARPPRAPKEFAPRNPGQREYLEKIRAHDLTICAGPAGVGKTYLAVAAALESVRRGETARLVLTRPAVEAGGEKLGFLPGDMEQKVNPYLRPLHEALRRLLGRAEAERRMAKSGRGAVEIIPLAFMRGLTLESAFVILDEAQNAAPAQIKMLLTRLGPDSKIVVAGDDTQIDLPNGESGLADAVRRLRGVPGVATHRFSPADIVRHPLTRAVLSAYESPR